MGIHKFRILVDNVPLATATINWWGTRFSHKVYKLSTELVKGKKRVRVTFRGLSERDTAGFLFECKILKGKIQESDL